MIRKSLALTDLAALICDACRKKGIDAVLSGGACVSIYTKNRYESFGLDFVLPSHISQKRIGPVLEPLGFRKDGRHYRHPGRPYIVEFLPPPLSVGEEPVLEIHEIRRGRRTLRLLSPTDCVKDRLAAFYLWNDNPALVQAVMVCKHTPVDLREVRRWSVKEGMKAKFESFKRALFNTASK